MSMLDQEKRRVYGIWVVFTKTKPRSGSLLEEAGMRQGQRWSGQREMKNENNPLQRQTEMKNRPGKTRNGKR